MILKLEPVITEKTVNLAKEHKIYTFKGPIQVTKEEVKAYFSKIFGYTVVKIRVVKIPGKKRRDLRSGKKYTKKAYKKFYIEFAEKVKFKGFA